MKHLFKILPKLTAIAAVALSISSCNRAEYAMLPKTTPYHATYGTTKTVPTPAIAKEQVAVTEAAAAEASAKNAVATAPATSQVQAPAASAKAAKSAATPAPRKSNLVQRVAVAKMLKQVDKATAKVNIKKRTETAGAKRIEGKLRQGLILILVGLLLSLFSGLGTIGAVIGIIGGVLFIVGVVLIILYLLDEL